MFTIQKFANALGVSTDAIRHYTELELLSPTTLSNRYKIYSEHDFIRLAQIRSLRSLEFSLSETQQFGSSPVEKQLALLEIQARTIQNEIDALQQKLSRLEQVRCFFSKSVLCNGTVEHVKRPPIYGLFTYGSHIPTIASERVQQWMDKVPYIHLSIRIPLEELSNPNYQSTYHVALGLGVVEDYVRTTQLDLSAPVERIPAGEFLILYIKTSDPLKLTPQELYPLIQYAQQKKLRFTHSTTGRILSIEDGNPPCYYLLIRVRVEPSTP